MADNLQQNIKHLESVMNKEENTDTPKSETMSVHKTGTREEWLVARAKLLKAEKELTVRSDEVAQQRRELPWVRLDKVYRFESDAGSVSLVDLFCGRSQLVAYHFMFGPGYTAGCLECSATADSFNGVLPHLAARDVTMVCISRAPLEKLLAYRERMGWSFNWASSYESDFNFDFGVSANEQPHEAKTGSQSNELAAYWQLGDQRFRDKLPPVVAHHATASGTDVAGYLSEGHAVSVFAREGDDIFYCYSSYTRGTEFLMGYYAILDRTPKGRNEGPTRTWLRRHDEYDKGASKDCCS
jgi:predicted dithiol-disulfide oxidoreductase (DUF899 family)